MSSSPVEAPVKVVRFGLFEVDLESNELRKKGLRVKLQDQQLNLLRILLEHPGTLVTRDELRHRLWKPGTFVEFDHSLNTAMMRLREVLGDSSDNPMLIETVRRKGYRFIAPVHEVKKEQETQRPLTPIDTEVEDELNLAVATPEYHSSNAVPIPPARQALLSRAVLAGLAVVVFVGSIAVLPMENLSGDNNQDYFADGMTDELIASLARISSLRVISRTTAMEYKGTHESLEKIGRDLHVDAVVEGTVLRSGDRVRITAELVQVSTDRHLWADTYESPLGDILALQNQVAAAIVSQIRIKLTPQDKESLAATRPINAGAFEDYLKGRYYWGKRSQDGLDKAIHYFQSATEKDPTYALAYAGRPRSGRDADRASYGSVQRRLELEGRRNRLSSRNPIKPELRHGSSTLLALSDSHGTHRGELRRDEPRQISRPSLPEHEFQSGLEVVHGAPIRSGDFPTPQHDRNGSNVFVGPYCAWSMLRTRGKVFRGHRRVAEGSFVVS